MSKKISYKGKITPGTDAHLIKLSTLKGKTGYKLNKLSILSTTPGANEYEYICQVFSGPPPSSSATVDFTNDNLMGVAYIEDHPSAVYVANPPTIIFDNAITNQDIYITIVDGAGGTTPCNFYIELETMSLSDLQTTQLTLKNLRRIASRV